MATGIVGRKLKMTRIFLSDGSSVPVTVIEVEPNRITRVKTKETDGYNALQVTVGQKKASKVNKPEAGHFAKAGVEAGRGLWEFAVNENQAQEIQVGSEITVEIFNDVKKVDVTGQSKGKGFQGAVKRWNFKTQDMSHGNSLSHRAPGSIGQNQTPGRVFKGKKMAGQMGNKRHTTLNLDIIRVDVERNLLIVKGAVPGASGSDVVVRPAVKAS